MHRRLVGVAAVIAMAVTLVPCRAVAAAWWEPVAFGGHDVTAVRLDASVVSATVDGRTVASTDGGGGFHDVSSSPAARPAAVSAAGTTWAIVDGHVVTGSDHATLHPDPVAPFLGSGATLIAAPAAVPGLVLAVGTDDHVWRRSPAGAWTTALVLLPGGGLAGPPKVTGLQAFTAPLSPAVYLATDGEGVLLTDDGGADWIRTDGAGLPSHVHDIAVDNATRTLYAATADGLWRHHLQSFPRAPRYADASLWLRWLGVAGVGLSACVGAVWALRRWLPAPA